MIMTNRIDTIIARLCCLSSQPHSDEERARAIRNLSILPGLDNRISYKPLIRAGEWNADLLISALDTYDSRVIWTTYTRKLPLREVLNREKMKMAKVGVEGSDLLNNLDYVLLNVSRNLWVGPNGTYTKEPGEAVTMKRLPALDQFIESCKANSGDYNVPVRLQDLVACSMGLDE